MVLPVVQVSADISTTSFDPHVCQSKVQQFMVDMSCTGGSASDAAQKSGAGHKRK